jgi:large subunit ribosomal protein L25
LSVNTVMLEAEIREILGKNVKILRARGLVPGNIYGGGRPSTPVQIPEKSVTLRVLRSAPSTLFTLDLADGPRQVQVREIQRHPISRQVLHVDFQEQS